MLYAWYIPGTEIIISGDSCFGAFRADSACHISLQMGPTGLTPMNTSIVLVRWRFAEKLFMVRISPMDRENGNEIFGFLDPAHYFLDLS